MSEASGEGCSLSEQRQRWPTREEKQRAEWGERQAQSLWDGLYARWSPEIDGRVVLDLGCSWGYLLRFLAERFRPRRLIGTDPSPAWRTVDHGWDYEALGGLVCFFEGDLPQIEQLALGSIDTILCTSVLQYMTPESLAANLDRAYGLLRPGGEVLLRTRVFTSYVGADLHRDIALPYAHLLYPEAELVSLVQERRGRNPNYLNWLTASSYLMMFMRAGFEIREARRRFNKVEPDVIARVAARYPWISEEERNCAEVEARLVRPPRPPRERSPGSVRPTAAPSGT